MFDLTNLKKLNYEELENVKVEVERLLEERKKEKDDLDEVLNLVKKLGYASIEDLGLTKKKSEAFDLKNDDNQTQITRPPKLRIVAKEKVSFYKDENNEWQIITIPTVKKKLKEVDKKEVIDFDNMDEELSNVMEKLYTNYENQIITNYNNKVSSYNVFARSNNLEELKTIELKKAQIIEE